MLPLVSICIPVYNSDRFIAHTIESVLNQTYQNWELILINDGSTDDSVTIIKQFNDPRIVYIEQGNRGAAAARNVALNNCRGEFVQFLDADDLIPPDKIAKQIALIKDNKLCLVGCNWVRFRGSTGQTFGAVGPHASIRKNCSPIEWLLSRHTMLIHCWLTPIDLVKKAGLWDERLTTNDDGEYFARVIGEAEKVFYCGETMVFYRCENTKGISSMPSEADYRSIYLAAVSYKNTMNRLASGSAEAKIAIGNAFKELIYFFYPGYPLLVQQCMEQPEIKFSTAQYNPGGYFARLLTFLIGWKLTRRIIVFWQKFKSAN